MLNFYFLVCGNAFQNTPVLAPEGISGCSMPCAANSSEYCGGGSRLDVYKLGYSTATSTVCFYLSIRNDIVAMSVAESANICLMLLPFYV